MNMPNILSYTT